MAVLSSFRGALPGSKSRGRPVLVSHRTKRPSRKMLSGAALQKVRLMIQDMADRSAKEGQKRLKAMAVARGGKHQVGYLKRDIGNQRIQSVVTPKKGPLSR